MRKSGSVLFVAAMATLAISRPASADSLPAYTQPTPAPGSVVVRLDGRFRTYIGMWDDRQFNQPTFTTSTTGVKTRTGENKQATFGVEQYVRLYPGFDGVTTAGLRYGAAIEIRQDSTVAPGGGANGNVGSAEEKRGVLYVRREWGYLGSARLGTLRFGTQDGASSLFLAGTTENFNDGGWNGDVYYGFAINARLPWPFENGSSVYPTTKVVYLSPSFAGLDFGLSWEPSSAGGNANDGNCTAAGVSNTVPVTGSGLTVPPTVPGGLLSVGCDRLSATSNSAESGRHRNTFDAMMRYRAVFGPVGLVAEGGYIGGSHISYNGPATTGSGSSLTAATQYEGLSVGDFGTAITYAGLQLGAHYTFGRFNNSLANGGGQAFSTTPVGGKDARAWTAGASYSAGPVILGASYLDVTSQGAFVYGTGVDAKKVLPGLGPRDERGVQAGGTLKLVPGVGVFLSYLWDERRQPGFDFVAGNEGTVANSATLAHNQVRAQALTLGTSLTW